MADEEESTSVAVVDNKAGILPREKTVLDIFNERINRALKNNKEISFRIAVGFFFFEGFQKLYPFLRKLYKKGLLKEFKVVMGPETKKSTKEILQALKSDAAVLNNDTFNFIKRLYDERKFDFRIFLERNFHIKMYMFEIGDDIEIWAGSANLTEAGLEENVELIVPTILPTYYEKDLYRNFFERIWEKSSDNVENLKTIDIIREASSSELLYLQPREFIANLLKLMHKEYLVENVSIDLSYLGEFQTMSYYLCLDRMNTYGGCILANSYGLGKTDVACLIAKYYKERGGKVLIIYPPVIEEHWKRTLEKVGLKREDVEWLSRGMLQKSDFNYEKYQNIDLIIVDEAHNFRVSKPKSNRRENLENIIKKNPNSHVLLITATPINTSFLDLTELIKLFVKGDYKQQFEREGILKQIYSIEQEVKKEGINKISTELIEKLDGLTKKFTVRIEWSDLIKYFPEDLKKISGKDKIESPDVFQITYAYNDEITKSIFDEIIPFLEELNFEYTKLWEKEYEEDKNLIWWYKWRLYKRLESSIFAFKTSLKNLLEKNKFLENFLKKVTVNQNYKEKEKLFGEHRLENIKNTFLSLSNQQRNKVLKKIRSDIVSISGMLEKVQSIKNLEENDEKIKKLLEILQKESDKPALIFSESRDTVIYIRNRLRPYKFKLQVAYGGETAIDEEPENEIKIPTTDKDKIQEGFNKGEFNILVTTDIMGEGTNLPGPEDKNPIVINFDLPYNPVKLIQRDGRVMRLNHPKKVTIYNFEPDKKIDKELELCERVAKRIENIISTIGLDFAIWAVEEKKIKDLSKQSKKRIIKLIREYKDLLATKPPEELKRSIPTLSKEDKAFREFIKYYELSEESIKYLSRRYEKPIFTGLEKNDGTENYFVVFEYKGSIYTIGELTFSGKKSDTTATKQDLEKVNSLISEKCLELDKEFLKTPVKKDRIDHQIDMVLEKNEKLKNAFGNVDFSTLPKKDKKIILEQFKKIKALPPWKKDDEIKRLQIAINEKIRKTATAYGGQQSVIKPKLLAVIKYV